MPWFFPENVPSKHQTKKKSEKISKEVVHAGGYHFSLLAAWQGTQKGVTTLTVTLSALPPFITAFLYLTMGFFVLSRVRPGEKKKVAYSFWLFTTVHWQLCMVFNYSLKTSHWVPFLMSLVYTGIVFIPVSFYHLMIEFSDAKKDFSWLWVAYGFGFFFAVGCWIPGWMVDGFYHYSWGYYPRAGWLHPAYLVFLVLLVIRMLMLLFQSQNRKNLSAAEYSRIKLLRWAFICYLPASFDFAINYGLQCYPMGFIFTLISLGLVSYAIVRHQLFDIRLIIRKTFIYSILTLMLTVVYVAVLILMTKILEVVVGGASIYSSAAAAATIAILFQPARSRIQEWMDRYFPRESLNQTILREATSGFVHEIKRPLANISMPAQLALADIRQARQEGCSDPRDLFLKLDRYLTYIVDQSLEAGYKIEAIRSLASQAALEKNPVDVGALLVQIVAQEEPRIQKENISLSFVPPETTFYTKGHQRQLEIALTNVLKNAIDALSASPLASRCLRISLAHVGQKITVDIEDSGPGIAATELAHIFDPWFTTKGSSGMGIGLYLTHEILKLHDASIDVQSRPGATVFRFSFPATGHED